MTARQKRKIARKCFGILAILAFVFALGSVGALERGSMTVFQAGISIITGLADTALFSWLAGWLA